jgi:hypothetical protein
MRKLIYLIPVAFTFLMSNAQTPAFPGAEGHGRYAAGGRGGTVYYVTTLEDNNTAGSLRYAVGRSGARTILFKISGTIQLKSELKISNDNVTIAGQSAPGCICIAGYPVSVNANNVIVRYLRFRMGDAQNINADGADALGGRYKKNIIVDHCSISWSTDECASFYNNENFTMQWCIISESLRESGHSKGAHGYGGIWGGMKASFHHNLMAHHGSRVPRLGPGENSTKTNELTDVRNNVYFNYTGEGCYGAEAMHVNIVNNYYKPGPVNTWNAAKKGRIIAIDKKTDNSFPAINDTWGTFYIDGNVVHNHANATNDNWTYGVYNQIHSKYGTISQETKDALKLSIPLATDVVTTHTAEKAYEQVLLYAGCSLGRDDIDNRIVDETRNNTYTFKGSKSNMNGIIDSQNDLKPGNAGEDWSPWITPEQTEVPADSNSDGIPDGWMEENHTGKTATDKNEEGYTYLEVYINSLVEHITTEQNKGGTNTSLNFTAGTHPDISVFLDLNKMLNIYSEDIMKEISVYSLFGTKITSVNVQDNVHRMNLAGMSKGIYLLQIFSRRYVCPVVKKIII